MTSDEEMRLAYYNGHLDLTECLERARQDERQKTELRVAQEILQFLKEFRKESEIDALKDGWNEEDYFLGWDSCVERLHDEIEQKFLNQSPQTLKEALLENKPNENTAVGDIQSQQTKRPSAGGYHGVLDTVSNGDKTADKPNQETNSGKRKMTDGSRDVRSMKESRPDPQKGCGKFIYYKRGDGNVHCQEDYLCKDCKAEEKL